MTTLMRSALLLSLLTVPAAASAQTTQGFISPYLGGTFAGGDLAKSGASTVGVSAGWMGNTWGFEGDVADTSGFFEQDGFLTNRRVTTAMGNVLVGLPMRLQSGAKTYVAGGVGLLQPHLSEAGDLANIDVKQPGFNVGAGILWMKNAVGVRGDVRYFRGFGDDANDVNAFGLDVSTLHFVRATVGLVVGF